MMKNGQTTSKTSKFQSSFNLLLSQVSRLVNDKLV